MSRRAALKLSFTRKAGLAIVGVAAVAIPVILGVTNAPALRAQADPNLRFEAATVRRVEIDPVDGGRVLAPIIKGGFGKNEPDPLRIRYEGIWLFSLISDAFGVRADQITGPDWLKKQRYDITANIPEGATPEQFNVMLGNLLRDRFHMRFHMDSKVIPVYALRVGKNGPKFKETTWKDDPSTPARAGGGPDAQGFPIVTPNFRGMVGRPVQGEIFWTAQDVSIAELARSLENRARRPVVDETGLKGNYDFKIRYENIRTAPNPDGGASDPVSSVFDAVDQQLGLKLESSSASFPQLIIDSMDQEPTEN